MLINLRNALMAGKKWNYVDDAMTDEIIDYIPSSTAHTYLTLDTPISPLADFTVEGTLEYVGTGTADGATLAVQSSSANSMAACFSLWHRGTSIVGRCFASEGTSSPVVTNIDINSKFYFALVYKHNTSMDYYGGGTIKWSATPSFWTWATASNQLSDGLRVLSMAKDYCAIMERLYVHSRVLTADEIARNYAIDKARFGLP